MGRAETAQSSSSGPADSPPVLLATDGSPDARIALRVAVDLALRTGAPLHLLHAWMEPVWYDYMYGLPTTLEFRGEAEAVLKTEAARATRAGVPPVHAHLETGRPGWAAKREAERINSGLLVVGSRGLGAIGRFVTGSVSDELVQHAPCPVLVCRGDRRSWPPTHIVVGDDLSDDSYSAALAAARIAGALDLPVHLAHAIPPRYASNGTAGSVRRRQDAERAATRAMQDRASRLEAEAGVKVVTEVVVGDPARALLDHVSGGGKYGLITVGRRGRGMVKRTLLGSVSTKLILSLIHI